MRHTSLYLRPFACALRSVLEALPTDILKLTPALSWSSLRGLLNKAFLGNPPTLYIYLSSFIIPSRHLSSPTLLYSFLSGLVYHVSSN